MTSLWQWIKNDIVANLHQFSQSYLLLLIIPLGFSLLAAFAFSGAYQPNYKPDPISVTIKNEDQGQWGQALVETLNSEEMNRLIDLEEDGDYEIIIPSDYSKDLGQESLKIHAGPGASRTSGKILQNILSQWQETVIKDQRLTEAYGDSYAAFLADYMEQLERYSEDFIALESYKTDKTLTASQYQSISNLLIIIFFILTSTGEVLTNDNFSGLRKRLGILPINAFQRHFYEIISNVIQLTALAFVYMVIWRLIDSTSFAGHLWVYAGWFALYAFLIMSISQFFILIFSPSMTNFLIQMGFILYLFLGVMPLENMFGGKLGEILGDNTFKNFLTGPFFDYFQNGQITQHLDFAAVLLISGLLILFLTIFIDHRKEVRV